MNKLVEGYCQERGARCMTGARIILEMLRSYGVKCVFGLPGETTLGWYLEWKDFPDVEYVLARDERSASFMAEAYARATNKPGVFEVPSPGVTHCVPGIAEAFKGSMPVICFSSDIPYNWDKRNMLTGCDQPALFNGIVKESMTVTKAEDIPFLLRRAFRIATTGRPGPVHVRIPQDIFYQNVDVKDIYAQKEFAQFPSHRCVAEYEAMAKAIDLLSEAKSPLMCLGQGALVSRAWDEAVELAEILSIPVGTTMTGKGAFPESHPLSIGVIGSRGGTSFSNSFVEAADVIFYVGSNTDSATTNAWRLPDPASGKRFIQLDIAGVDIGNMYSLDVVMIGDAKATLREMVKIAKAKGRAPRYEREAEIKSKRASFEKELDKYIESDEGLVNPLFFIRELSRKLPNASHIICDPGVGGIYTAAFFRQEQAGRRLYFNYSMGALGYALPGAIGVAASESKRCTVVMTGDGSMGFTCGELETISRLGWNIKVFLFQNDSFGWIRGEESLICGFEPFATDFVPVDYLKVAEGFGIRAYEVKDHEDLPRVLEEVFSTTDPCLITLKVATQDKLVPPVPKWVAVGQQRGLKCIY